MLFITTQESATSVQDSNTFNGVEDQIYFN